MVGTGHGGLLAVRLVARLHLHCVWEQSIAQWRRTLVTCSLPAWQMRFAVHLPEIEPSDFVAATAPLLSNIGDLSKCTQLSRSEPFVLPSDNCPSPSVLLGQHHYRSSSTGGRFPSRAPEEEHHRVVADIELGFNHHFWSHDEARSYWFSANKLSN